MHVCEYRFLERQKEIEKINSCNRWKKRGISMLPVKFGIAFTALHMNQVKQNTFKSCSE